MEGLGVFLEVEQGLEHGLEEWSERKGGFKDDANIFTLNSWQKGGAIFF